MKQTAELVLFQKGLSPEQQECVWQSNYLYSVMMTWFGMTLNGLSFRQKKKKKETKTEQRLKSAFLHQALTDRNVFCDISFEGYSQ